MQHIHFGNAYDDGTANRQWFIGHFVDAGSDELRRDDDVEVRLSRHPAGETRDVAWAPRQDGKSMTMLISGRFIMTMPDREFELIKQGDYVLWGPGVAHTWEAIEDTVMVTVRWPSKPVTIDEGRAE